MAATVEQRARITALLTQLRQVGAVCRQLNLPPVSAASMRKSFPSLDAVEQIMPGVTAMVIGAVAGDPESEHKLEAILTCPDPPSPNLQ